MAKKKNGIQKAKIGVYVGLGGFIITALVMQYIFRDAKKVGKCLDKYQFF